MAELIAFRALQGIGAGGLIVGSQAIIGDVVSPRQRGRYMGYFGAVFGLATRHRPPARRLLRRAPELALGLLHQHPDRHRRTVRRSRLRPPPAAPAPPSTAIDYLGAALLGAGVTCIVLLTTWGGTTYAWASRPIVGLAVAARVLHRGIHPGRAAGGRADPPARAVPQLAFSRVTNAIGFIVGFAMFGAIIFLPLYLQTVKGA